MPEGGDMIKELGPSVANNKGVQTSVEKITGSHEGKSLRQTLREKAGKTGLSSVEQGAEQLSAANRVLTAVEVPPETTPRFPVEDVYEPIIGPDGIIEAQFRPLEGPADVPQQPKQPEVIVINSRVLPNDEIKDDTSSQTAHATANSSGTESQRDPLKDAIEGGATLEGLLNGYRVYADKRSSEYPDDRRARDEAAIRRKYAEMKGGDVDRNEEPPGGGKPEDPQANSTEPAVGGGGGRRGGGSKAEAAAEQDPRPQSWGQRFEQMMDRAFSPEEQSVQPNKAFVAEWSRIRTDLERQNKDRMRAAREEHRGKGSPRNPNTFGAIQPEVEAALELLNKSGMIDVRNRLVGELIQGARPFSEIQKDIVRAASVADRKEAHRRVMGLREEKAVYEVAGNAIGLFDQVREAERRMRDTYMLNQLGVADQQQTRMIAQVEEAVGKLEAGARNKPGFQEGMKGMIQEYWAATKGNWEWAVVAGGIRDERKRPSRDQWAAREINHLTDIEAAQLLRAGEAVNEQAYGLKKARRSVDDVSRSRSRGDGGTSSESGNGHRTVEAAAELEHTTFSQQFLKDHHLPTYVYVPETTEGGTRAVPRDMQTILYTVMQTGRAPRIEANQLARAWGEEKLAEKRMGVTLTAEERRNLRGMSEEEALSEKRKNVQLTAAEKQQVTQESTFAQQELVNGIIPILIMRYNERGTLKTLVGDKGGGGAIWESGFHMGFAAQALLRDSQALSALRIWMAISGRPGDNFEAADMTPTEKRFARQQKALMERRMMEAYAQNVPERKDRVKNEAMTLNDKEVSRAEAKAIQDAISQEMVQEFGIDPGVEQMMRTLTMILGWTPEFMDARKYLGTFEYLWRGPIGQKEQAAMPIVMRPTDSSGNMFVLDALKKRGIGAMLEEWRGWTYSNSAIGLMYNGMLDTNKNLTLISQMVAGKDNFPDTETRHKEIDKMAEQMAAGEIPAISRDTLAIIKSTQVHGGRGLNYQAGVGLVGAIKRDTEQGLDKIFAGTRPTKTQVFDILFPGAGMFRRWLEKQRTRRPQPAQEDTRIHDEAIDALRQNEADERERRRRQRRDIENDEY